MDVNVLVRVMGVNVFVRVMSVNIWLNNGCGIIYC